MEPLTLIALAAAAGFIFKATSNSENNDDFRRSKELDFSRDVVTRAKKPSLADFDISSIDVLPEYELVRELIKSEFPLVFVTGGAGTGKSTFIKWLTSYFDGKVLLGAPTAMAAINVGGKTLHSLCQLPPTRILKQDIKQNRLRREIKEAKLLIIDEISMVNANLLDGVSAFLRKNRGINKPFGNLPVVMVGDMFQLPPIVLGKDKAFFERYYNGSAKFYNARCLNEITYYAVELKKTFRQSDQEFVDLLVRIREGVDLNNAIQELNSRCTICTEPPESAIWLSPRNAEVDSKNAEELDKLQGSLHIYNGIVSGKFQSDRLPSPMELVLKPGAQVMFTKNDSKKRWINGTVGIVEDLRKDSIIVQLASTNELVEVVPVEWQDYRYSWNSQTKEIERNVIGSFTQFPLLLGWAITIHKSQGRTLEKVHLDLGAGAFETGQTYVALSRCRAINGLSISRPLAVKDILIDIESKEYYDNLRQIISKLPPKEMLKQLTNSKVANA